MINDGENSDNNDDDSYNGIQTFKLKDADNLYVADYNGAVHHITTADGKIASSYDDFDWVNGMYLCGDKLLLDDYQKVIEDGNTIYYACTEGIFAYNLDNDTSEQIVDGNMSSLV